MGSLPEELLAAGFCVAVLGLCRGVKRLARRFFAQRSHREER